MSTISDFQTPLVTVQWLKSHINSNELVILDATINKVVNSSSERIPRARFFDIKNSFSDVKAQFPSTLPNVDQFQTEARKLGVNKNSIIVVYDDKGIYSSARAWWLFKVFGFENIAVLDGGLPEWKAKGFDIEAYSNKVYVQGNFEASFCSSLITDFDGISAYAQDTSTLILDARSEDRFKCLVDEPRDGLRRGTIPNSKNLPYTKIFNDYKLKSKEELSEIFNNLVNEERLLVFSCGSGITACILALAATRCGYNNLVVYDGSWTEYGTLTA